MKRIGWRLMACVSAIFILVVSMPGHFSQISAGSVQIWTDKNSYCIGDSALIFFGADHDCYAKIEIYKGGSYGGILSQGSISGGQTYSLPGTVGPPAVPRVLKIITNTGCSDKTGYDVKDCGDGGGGTCQEWLYVTCNVEGYDLYVDGRFVLTEDGDGECGLELQNGEHAVKLEKRGCSSVSRNVEIVCGDPSYLNVTMDCSSEEREPPSLTLFSPKVDGLTVTVNGAANPGTSHTTIARIHWEWGDGSSKDHWFPASHTYGQGGTYTVLVTAYQSDGLHTTETVDLRLEEEKRTGTVEVYVQDESGNAVSGASVYLDGNLKGETDARGYLVIVNVSEGYHVVKATRTGYEDDNKEIHVEANKRAKVYLNLKKITKTGSIMVYVQDESGNALSAASVYLDGSYQGETDVRGGFLIGDVPEGYHVVAAYKSGFYDGSEDVYVAAGKMETVHLKLEKEIEDLHLEIWTDKGCGSTYKTDELVTIYYKASKDCYVSLFEVFGESTSLFEQGQIIRDETYAASRILKGAGAHEFIIIAENSEARCVVYVEEEPPQTGSIMVYVQDESGNALSGASVYQDGDLKGETDVRGGFLIGDVPEGYHTITASKSGYADGVATVYVTAGKMETAHLKLDKGVKAGTIEVYVIDDSGSGLFEASVRLDDAFKGRTDSNGYLRITDVPEGYHVVKASKFGYTEDSREIYVAAGETVSAYLNISGPLTGSIKVYVFDNYHVGVSKADVYLDGEYWGDTDRKGYTRITDVPEGYHTVTASKSGYGEDSTTVYVKAGETETVNLYLTGPPPTGAVRVFVRDESDNQLSGASVYLDGNYQGETNRSGFFLIEEIPQGNHTVMASKSGFKDDSEEVYVEANKKVRVDLCLVGPPRGTIKVYVQDDEENNVSGASVYLDGRYEGETDEEGFLRIDNVPEGDHTVRASKYGYEDSEKVHVEAGKIVRVELYLKPGPPSTGTIKVYVRDEFNSQLSGASVYLDGNYQGETNRSGFFQIDNVSEGDHTVKASKSGYNEHSEKIDMKVGEIRTIYLKLVKIEEPKEPSLTLFSPKVDGLTVTVNGAANPGTSHTTIARIHWEWGDGSSEDHRFPASHTYGQGGTYTVSVTAYQSDGLYTTQTVDVKLEEAEEEETGSIKVIAEDENGNGLEGAAVWREPDPIGICVVTDFNGECLIEDVEEGWNTVTASKEGYEDDFKSIYVKAGEIKTIYLTLVKIDESAAAEIHEAELESNSVCGKKRFTYKEGNIVKVKFRIKNSGNRKQVFYYGFSIENGYSDPWELEKPVKVEINPGELCEELSLEWKVPDLVEAPRGGYEMYVIVWGKKSDESFYELDRSEPQEFSVAECVHIEEADVWFEGTSGNGVARLCFTDDTYENVMENACLYAQKITEEAEKRGYDVRKSLQSMTYEIYVHLLYYPIEKEFHREEDLDSKPIDIELDSDRWVSPNFLLDYLLPIALERLPPCVEISASISIGDLESSYTSGDTVEIETLIENKGNIFQEFTAKCEVFDSNDNYYDFPYEEIELDPGESETVRFLCNISTGAPEGEYQVVVSVYGLENRLDHDEKYFTVSSGTIGATISLEQLNPSYAPEDIVKVRTHITNTGNFLNTFIVECLIVEPNGNINGFPYEEIELDPGESGIIQFLYGIPAYALNGEYQVVVSVYGRDMGTKLENRLDHDSKHFTVSTIDATISIRDLEPSYSPEDAVEIVVDVVNTGYAPHSFIVECLITEPNGTDFKFTPKQIQLGPGESEIIRFPCEISTGAPEGEYRVVASVWERYASDMSLENRLDSDEKHFTVSSGTPPDNGFVAVTNPSEGEIVS